MYDHNLIISYFLFISKVTSSGSGFALKSANGCFRERISHLSRRYTKNIPHKCMWYVWKNIFVKYKSLFPR